MLIGCSVYALTLTLHSKPRVKHHLDSTSKVYFHGDESAVKVYLCTIEDVSYDDGVCMVTLSDCGLPYQVVNMGTVSSNTNKCGEKVYYLPSDDGPLLYDTTKYEYHGFCLMN